MLILLAYSNALTGGFVLDSKVLLLEDPRIRAATATNLDQILQRSYWWPYTDSNLYRPVTTLSFLVNYAVLGNGTNPIGYHAINLLLHAVNVLLAYAVALGLSRRFWPSLLVAAIWAVHPLSTEAVTNLTGRADLLAATGVLGALAAYQRSYVNRSSIDPPPTDAPRRKPARRVEAAGDSNVQRRQSMRWLLVAFAMAALGMFSKESGVAVIAVIVVYDVLFRVPSKSAWNWIVLLLPLGALLYQRARVLTALVGPEPFVDNPLVGAGFWQGRLTALSITGRYLWRTIWPRTLSSDYSYAQIPMASGNLIDWMAWIAVAALAAAAVFLVLTSLRGADRLDTSGRQLAGFALVFGIVTFVPASNLLFTTGTIMADRLMYLPSLGLIACVVFLLRGAAARTPPWLVPVVAAIVVALFTIRTFARNRDWRDDVSLAASAVRAAPGSFKAQQSLADALYEANPDRRDFDAIIAAADRSVAILAPLPDSLNVPATFRRAAGYYLERGDRLRTAGGGSESATAYERSVALTTRYLAILRATREARGNIQTLETQEKAEFSEGYVMLATGYSRLRNPQKAIEAAGQARMLAPLNPTPYRVLAAALIDGSNYDEAAVWLLTGFTVTGDSELRQATIDLYRGGGDPAGCAIRNGAGGPVLNPACETVRRHLCAATRKAIQVHLESARSDLAEQLERGPLQSYACQ